MDLKSESVVHKSVGTSEGVRSDSPSNNHGLHGEDELHNNGSYDVQNSNHGDGDEKGKGNTGSGSSGNASPVNSNSAASPSQAVTRKGYGLRKWKRRDRNSAKSSGGTGKKIDLTQFMKEDRSNSRANPSKRVQVYVEKESSENSVSSTNAVVKNSEGFALSGEPILGPEALFGAATDSDNSEDRSSKSSTAASGQPLKYDKPVPVGILHDKNKLRSLSGNKLTHSGKVRVEGIKKPGEGSMEILKETSVSSLESDSCTSNFVFMPAEASSMNNGVGGEKQFDCDGENGTQIKKKNDDHDHDKKRNSGEGYENISPDIAADSSTEVKVDKMEGNDFSADKDPLVEAMDSLQHAQELLEKELLKFLEIRKHIEDSLSGIHGESAASDEENLQKTSSRRFSANQDVENEIELLLKSKIEAEVDYLTISGMVRNLREEALASAEAQITENIENKAVVLKNKAEELEKVCEETANDEESSKIQTKICKNASYFFIQMVLLVFVFGLYTLKSQSYEDVVPT